MDFKSFLKSAGKVASTVAHHAGAKNVPILNKANQKIKKKLNEDVSEFEQFMEATKPEFSTHPDHETHATAAKHLIDNHKHDGWEKHHELYHGSGSKLHHHTEIHSDSVKEIHHALIKKGYTHSENSSEHTYKHSSGVHVSIDKHAPRSDHEITVSHPLTKTAKRTSPVKKKLPIYD